MRVGRSSAFAEACKLLHSIKHQSTNLAVFMPLRAAMYGHRMPAQNCTFSSTSLTVSVTVNCIRFKVVEVLSYPFRCFCFACIVEEIGTIIRGMLSGFTYNVS